LQRVDGRAQGFRRARLLAGCGAGRGFALGHLIPPAALPALSASGAADGAAGDVILGPRRHPSVTAVSCQAPRDGCRALPPLTGIRRPRCLVRATASCAGPPARDCRRG
jgi:hypothetical protein